MSTTTSSSPPPTDHGLLEQARSGDPLALGPLLASYAVQLRRLAERRLDEQLRNRVSASDVVQETLLQATQDFEAFRGQSDAEFAGWLRRILVRKVSRALERHLWAEKRDVRRELPQGRAAVDEPEGGYSAGGAVIDHRPGPASELLGNERNRHVEQALAALPRPYRQVIELRNAQGLPFEEIARRLGRTSGAARMLWLRAIDSLRQQLNPQDS